MYATSKIWIKRLFSPQTPASISKGYRSKRPSLELLEAREVPATFIVQNSNDSGLGSLRAAIQEADFFSGADTIEFNAGMTINLTSTGDNTIGPSAFAINSEIEITAFDVTNVSLTATNQRLFYVAPGGSLTLTSLTLANSRSVGGSGADSGGGAAGMGGAIFNEGSLSLQNSILSGIIITLYYSVSNYSKLILSWEYFLRVEELASTNGIGRP